MKQWMFILLCFFSFSSLMAQLTFDFDEIEDGFSNPVDITNDGFNTDRLYVLQQAGVIKLMVKNINGTWETRNTPFLDLSSEITDLGEMGLLGLTFHPDFENNSYCYVNYTTGSSTATRKTIVERYTINGNGEVADLSSNISIIQIAQPYTNHNAGDLNFGPDGMLYIALGDGGSGNDPQERSQDLNELLGKMLRIDVNVTVDASQDNNYAIPSGNPFVGVSGAKDEIWSYGLRNPFRFSFDRLTGDVWLGDVGQVNLEEISFQSGTSTGGENFGWDCYEADLKHTDGEHPDCFDAQGNPLINHTPPTFQYGRNSEGGFSVIGGYVYRGSFTHLQGHYFFADYYTDNIWTIEKNGSSFPVESYGSKNVSNISSFGEDVEGELYLVSRSTGRVYQVTTTAVLAIQLVSFEGLYKNNQVELKWTSVTDSQSSHFEIERSANGTDFKNIGKVEAKEGSNNEQPYTFDDSQVDFSDIYYRLKMVNKDGSFEYSKAIIIYYKNEPEISIYPNPNNGAFNLVVNGYTDKAKPVEITIRTTKGEIAYRQKYLSLLLPFNQQLFLEKLPIGIYDVEVIFDGQALHHQMVKSK